MRFLELTLHDFRVYGGRQSLFLDPPSPGKPIILIGGLNGTGKTTLLDAIQLVLFGSRARCSSRGNSGYKDYLRKSIHRCAGPTDGASLELRFEHVSEGQASEYRVLRSWYATDSGVRERIEVHKDGVFAPLLTSRWDERVDDFVPQRIANLFFFDGEKIAALAAKDSSSEIVRTSIHSLLGLGLVERLIGDLSILDQKKRRTTLAAFDREKLAQIEQERDRLRGEVESRSEELGSLRNQLDRARQLQKEATDLYRREGGERAEMIGELERRNVELDSRLVELRNRLREALAGPLPLALLADQLQTLHERAQRESNNKEARLLAGLLEERDRDLLHHLTSAKTSKKALKAAQAYLTKDRVSRAPSPTSESDLSLSPECVRDLDRLLNSDLPSAVQHASTLRTDIERIEEERIQVQRELESTPDEASIAKIRDHRAEATASAQLLAGQVARLEEEKRRLADQEQTANDQIIREMGRELQHAEKQDRLGRLLDRLGTASSLLGDFREAILEKSLGRVQDAILESFRQLIRKPNLIRSLTVDPSSFEVLLRGPDGSHLDRDQLSAGEDQLLAVSILWGLARVAGLPLPVIIDTPLGRLDSKHRHNLVEHYFPHASHQVLLLSTDEEIEDSRLNDLRPFIGRSYLLEHEPETDRTLAREGYFWN